MESNEGKESSECLFGTGKQKESVCLQYVIFIRFGCYFVWVKQIKVVTQLNTVEYVREQIKRLQEKFLV